MQQKVGAVLASTLSGGIGWRGKLPWRIPQDLKHFEYITTVKGCPKGRSNGVIMGRKTWDSLPKKPLPNRLNFVVSRTLKPPVDDGSYQVVGSIEEGIEKLRNAGVRNVYITGGAALYDAAHKNGLAEKVYWTRVCGQKIKTDAKVELAHLEANYDVVSISKTHGAGGKISYDFCVLKKKKGTSVERRTWTPLECESRTTSMPVIHPCRPGGLPRLKTFEHDEIQYLTIMEEILKSGRPMEDRTGVGTLAKFGTLMRYDLSESFPLLTTKRVYWKGVLVELLWFLQGRTDARYLADRDVHIWDANGSREFLDGRGLTNRAEGDLGPVYGFQWRHFGAPYTNCHDDFTGKGYDQVKTVIDTIQKDPTSRRLIISAWNPAALHEMALPPCHMMCQFMVDPERKELSCLMYQRSADWGLGVPFNIASYALLTRIIAQQTNLRAKEFVHVCGNAHVYKNHVEPLKEQLTRLPRPFPQLLIDPSVKSIDDYDPKHFQLVGYEPWPSIKMEMAV